MVIHPPLFKWQYLHKKERGGPFENLQRCFFHMVFPVYLGTALAQRSTATTILASKPSPIYPASIVVNSSMPFQDILILSTSTDLHKPTCNSLVHKTAPDRSGEHKKSNGGRKLLMIRVKSHLPQLKKVKESWTGETLFLWVTRTKWKNVVVQKFLLLGVLLLKEDKSQFLFLEYSLFPEKQKTDVDDEPDVWAWSVLFS